MKLSLTSLILFFIATGAVLAQSNYKPGFIITSGGDTIKGYISYKKSSFNPSGFDFKSSNGDKKHCDLNNTQDVCIYGKTIYKRFVVYVSQDKPVDLNFIPGSDNAIGIDSTKKLDTVFLKQIISGKNIALYTYTDLTKKRFFVSEKNKTPVELVLHKYLEQEPVLTAVDDEKYKNQVQVLRARYVPTDTDLIDIIQLADYNEDDLSAIINNLNR